MNGLLRHGYYLAATDALHGDRELAEEARATWRALGRETPFGRYEGASVWIGANGARVRRAVVDDLFSETPKQCVRDIA